MTSLRARSAALGVATLTLGSLSGLGVAAHAGDDDFLVVRTGACSGTADWKLKVKREDGGLEAEFEVDSNRVGQTWQVRMTRNGSVVMSGERTTQAPSGSFEVERRISNSAGDDVIVGRAVHQPSGQVCQGRIVYTH